MIYQLVNNRPKTKLFLQKKNLSAGGSSLRPQDYGGRWGIRRWQMADGGPPGSGRWGIRPKLPIASGSWGQTPVTPPHCTFLAMRLVPIPDCQVFELKKNE